MLKVFVCTVFATLAVAYAPASTQDAWDNHHSAMRSQNLSKVMLDYDDNSRVQMYVLTDADPTVQVFNSTAAISDMFTGLFADLSDLSGFATPVVDVVEGNVLLVWECPSSGITFSTDSFFFDASNKIAYQNIVVEHSQLWKSAGTNSGRRALSNANTNTNASRALSYSPASTQAAFDNHFAAFVGRNVTQTMMDYDEDSEVRVYLKGDTNSTLYKGLASIETMYHFLFGNLWNLDSFSAPVNQVNGNTAFLVWQCPAIGFKWATDSFEFDDNHKIRFQNIVTDYTETLRNDTGNNTKIPPDSNYTGNNIEPFKEGSPACSTVPSFLLIGVGMFLLATNLL